MPPYGKHRVAYSSVCALVPLALMAYTKCMRKSVDGAGKVFFAVPFFCFFLPLCVPLAAQQTVKNPSASELRSRVVAAAKQYVGVPYRYGGTNVSGMDCSGFIYTVAREAAGVQLPRTTTAMYSFCRIVPDKDKEIGDILFFKTVGSKISHAGFYIGNNQFIHAVSDGLNTGVIVSSLNQHSWKSMYAGCGQFLPPGKKRSNDTSETEPILTARTDESPAAARGGPSEEGKRARVAAGKTARTASAEHNTEAAQNTTAASFFNNCAFDFSTQVGWNFYTVNSFLFNFRGVYMQAHARWTKWTVQPGFAAEIRIEPPMGMFQFPLLFTLSVPHGFRIYAGPVFTAGNVHLIGSDQIVSASIFPGTFGAGWQSPGVKIGRTELSFIQDIRWTVFNNLDNSALPPKESVVAGLVFSTGVCVTLKASDLLKQRSL